MEVVSIPILTHDSSIRHLFHIQIADRISLPSPLALLNVVWKTPFASNFKKIHSGHMDLQDFVRRASHSPSNNNNIQLSLNIPEEANLELQFKI